MSHLHSDRFSWGEGSAMLDHISPASEFKVHRRCEGYSWCIGAPVGVVHPFFLFYVLVQAATSHSSNCMVRLYFQCVRTDSAELLILAPTVNAIASVRNFQITLDVRRIVPRKTICNIVRAFSHLYTTIPLVTSQRTGESPVLMMLLITK